MIIDTDQVFKELTKQNGKKFAKIIRGDTDAVSRGALRANLLNTPDLVSMLQYAGKDPNDAIRLIPVIKEIHDRFFNPPEIKQQHIEDPIKLLNKAGYDAFYVKTLRQQNSIAKYFEPKEKLCTFNDPYRYKENYIIHAVKKNIQNIKRSSIPQRDDEYGTSVISIQIRKKGGVISIKNRYNHTVTDPDSTFNNNPDNIIPGLTEALKHKFGVDFTVTNSQIPYHYKLIKNQLVHFNYEVNDVYFDDTHYFSGSNITELNPKHEIMLDTVILDSDFGKKARNVLTTHNQATEELLRVLNNEIAGQKIKATPENDETVITIIDQNKQKKELARTKNGRITALHLYRTTSLGDKFLEKNCSLKIFDAQKLKKMGNSCFCDIYVGTIKQINIPELEEMGNYCFPQTIFLKKLNAQKLKKIGKQCFCYNETLEEINTPELEEMGESCFEDIPALKKLYAQKLKNTEKYPSIHKFLKHEKFRNILYNFRISNIVNKIYSNVSKKIH